MTAIAPATVAASSYYRNEGKDSDPYHPVRTAAGNKVYGGWISDVGQWDGAWIEYRFAESVRIAAVEIVNGFVEEGPAQSRDDYYYHLRLKDVTVSFPGSGAAEVALALADSKEPQAFALDPGRPVMAARIAVRSVYRDSPDGQIKPYNVAGLRSVEWRGEPG